MGGAAMIEIAGGILVAVFIIGALLSMFDL